jgi:hypothetical protein
MVEGGRLKEADIPDDYQWVVTMLGQIAALDPTDFSEKCRHVEMG